MYRVLLIDPCTFFYSKWKETKRFYFPACKLFSGLNCICCLPFNFVFTNTAYFQYALFLIRVKRSVFMKAVPHVWDTIVHSMLC